MFELSDFDVFLEGTLDGRMAKIRQIIDPKFEVIAKNLIPILEEQTDQKWYAHVAQHKMRTVYPPDNTWVAFSTNKRGYKMLPHFELGIWDNKVYLWFAMSENLKEKASSRQMWQELVLANREYYLNYTNDWRISINHMVNDDKLATKDVINQVVLDYAKYKNREVLIGKTMLKHHELIGSQKQMVFWQEILLELIPLYQKFI